MARFQGSAGEGSSNFSESSSPGSGAPLQADPGGSAEGVPPVSRNECPGDAPIKGNDSSSGELIYHEPEGQFYDVTNPEECFASAAEAEAAGYRASQR